MNNADDHVIANEYVNMKDKLDEIIEIINAQDHWALSYDEAICKIKEVVRDQGGE